MAKREQLPTHVVVETFQSDIGWRWRIKAWRGNVIVTGDDAEPPKLIEESRKGFVSDIAAERAAARNVGDVYEKMRAAR